MPPVSKIAKLPKQKLTKVDKVLADNTSTLREKKQQLQDQGVDVSLSGLHRYSQKMLQLGKEVNLFQNTARTIHEMNQTGGGPVVMSETIITFLQTALFKKILNEENLNELDPKLLLSMTSAVTKLANALVDLNKLPQHLSSDAMENQLSKLVEEHIKSLKPTEEAKKERKNAKSRKN